MLRFWLRFNCRIWNIISIACWVRSRSVADSFFSARLYIVLELFFFYLRVCQLGDLNLCLSGFRSNRIHSVKRSCWWAQSLCGFLLHIKVVYTLYKWPDDNIKKSHLKWWMRNPCFLPVFSTHTFHHRPCSFVIYWQSLFRFLT